jgi:hypothetical protein
MITKGSKPENVLVFAAAAAAAYNIERPPLHISYNCPFYLYVSLIGLCLQVIGMMCNKFVTFSCKSVTALFIIIKISKRLVDYYIILKG